MWYMLWTKNSTFISLVFEIVFIILNLFVNLNLSNIFLITNPHQIDHYFWCLYMFIISKLYRLTAYIQNSHQNKQKYTMHINRFEICARLDYASHARAQILFRTNEDIARLCYKLNFIYFVFICGGGVAIKKHKWMGGFS